MIDRTYIYSTDDPTHKYRLELAAIGPSEDGTSKGEMLLRIVTDESTFSRAEFVAAGADKAEDSDNGFDHNLCMISVDLNEFADMVELLRKHA